jgi:tetratricopeptide (TPR) repeat protein
MEGDLNGLRARVSVRYVVDGRIEGEEDRLEVTVRVREAATEAVLHEEKSNGRRVDLFTLRARIARATMRALDVPLNQSEELDLAGEGTADIHAYDCYLRARSCIVSFKPEEINRALEILQCGLDLVGDNALLYATMGMVYWNLLHSGASSDESVVRQAEEHATKAFTLDPDLAQGHVLAGLLARMRGRRRDSVTHLRRALSIDPNNPDGLYWLACVYAIGGRCASAWPLARRLMERDPLTGMSNYLPSLLLMLEGQFEEALDPVQRACRLDPNPTGRVLNAIALVRARRLDRAHAEFDRLAADVPDAFAARLGVFLQHAIRGRRDEAMAAAPSVERIARSVEYLAWEVGVGYGLIREYGAAIVWLNHAAALGFTSYPFLMCDPLLAGIRHEPVFEPLARRIREEWEAFDA